MKIPVSTMICLVLAFAGQSFADFPGWKHSGSVFILTTPEGAELPASASVEGFPVLVRLHRDYFDFGQAKPQGEDLRFSTATGEPLAYQIEEWDAGQGVAGIWVRVPKIVGNARQELKLYWGKPDASSESNGKAVFNDSNGYVSVWHMNEQIQDEVGTLTSIDTGTTKTVGQIGVARHFPGQKGVFGGEKIPNYPSGASTHTTEVWFRTEKPNSTIIGWGNEGGGRGSKIRMQFRSPPHIHIDSDFSDVDGKVRIPMGEWTQVTHTYERENGRIYINGQLDNAEKPMLDIKSPSRLWIGGWYNNYDFVGDIDEVRISKVARSADWIKLQYENQKPHQTLVGHVTRAGDGFSVSPAQAVIAEGQSKTFVANARGAQKIYWIVKRDGRESIAATDRLSFTLEAGRVVKDASAVLQCRAIYSNEVKTADIAITIQEAIPEPVFTLTAPARWDGRQTIEIVPRLANLNQMQASGAADLHYTWHVDGLAVIRKTDGDKLILKRAQNSGTMKVTLAIDNGGVKTVASTTVVVTEPTQDAWVRRTPSSDEHPEDNQFVARDDKNEGTVYYTGKLTDAADGVFVRVYADGKLDKSLAGKIMADKSYSISVPLKAGLINYRLEFGTRSGDRETVLQTASNVVCGDAYLIDGQSNADATDVGKEDPDFTSDWIRSFGSMAGHPEGGRLKRWGNAVVRDRNGGKLQIGAWGMQLARDLVESQKIPICILNGAIGGTRIDQHQRNAADPTDATTIYGRLLWRVRAARLDHGIRGILWHQGENDQGADGPTGGFGWETYRQFFIEMSAGWKEDYPNVQHYYVFQIWPKACSMGIRGSDNKLREVQRLLTRDFSNLSVMSTLGIKPPGGCHYPLDGYAQFAHLIRPLVEQYQYQKQPAHSVTPADLKRASFAGDQRDRLVLEFDQDVAWSDPLINQFYLDGMANQVLEGTVSGKQIVLKLRSASQAKTITYLDSATWNQNNLLYGQNGLAALTFCDVPIE